MGFIKNMLSSCLGVMLAFIALILIGFFTAAILASEKEVEIGDNSVLQLKLNTPISELEVEDPLAELFPGAGEQRIGLIQLKQIITHAQGDDQRKGIYLNISRLMTGIATVDEIRQALLDFRKSGKWVIAYSDAYSEGGYYLAS